MNKRVELLLPAGNIEKLDYAINYGADAVYMGMVDFSLRSMRKGEIITAENLKKAIDLAHSYGKKVYMTLNIYAYDDDIIKQEKFNIETGAGIKQVELIIKNNKCIAVKVDMGKAEFLNNPTNNEYDLNCVSVGNPHAVMIVENFDNNIVKDLGPKIENHKGFINKTNVEFAKIIDKENIDLRVWERGCGETEACGTGACATVSVLNHIGLLSNHCNVNMLGGMLTIDIINNEIFMTGEAIKVFDGEIEI